MSPAILETGWTLLAIAAAISSGLMLTFSNFVMPALDRVPPTEATRAMQRINEDVINPLFLTLFMGTGPAMLVWLALHGWQGGVSWAQVAGAALYGLGVVGVTIGGNVPLNDALARQAADDATPESWAAYARPWVRWNHLRTTAAAAASAVLLLGA